jgi:hypothetical protein
MLDFFKSTVCLRAVGKLNRAIAFLIGLIVVVYAVSSAAAEGDLRQNANFSTLNDIKYFLHLRSSYVSAPVISLQRDILSLLLIVLVGLTFLVAYVQVCAISECMPQLEKYSLLKWRSHPDLTFAPRILRRTVAKTCGPGVSGREGLERWIDTRFTYLRRTEIILTLSALLAAAGFQYAIYATRSFEILAPSSMSGTRRAQWAREAYRSWWASYYHVPGAVAFVLIAAFGILVVFVQNSVNATIVSAASVLRCYAEPQIDWLNADGHYGWMPVERIFRASYMTTVVRALTISVLIIGFGIRNASIVVTIGIIWLCFIIVYHVVPYKTWVTYINKVKHARIQQLVNERNKYTTHGRRGLEITRFYAEEIDNVRNARINPMHLPRWRASWFIVSILLPIVLAIFQIAF